VPLVLHNTLTRRKEAFAPLDAKNVRMYVCGPTVYARAHVGNARPFILGMWLRSWLRHNGYDATLVHNITDINDKIYDAAAARHVGSAELAARKTEAYREDTSALGLGRPTHEPLASETIGPIVESSKKPITVTIAPAIVPFTRSLARVPTRVQAVAGI